MKKKIYNREQAIKELIKRGFGKDKFTYQYRHEDGTYEKNNFCDNMFSVQNCKGNGYLDCGDGYLWSEAYPDLLHKGTEEYLAKVNELNVINKLKTFEELLNHLS